MLRTEVGLNRVKYLRNEAIVRATNIVAHSRKTESLIDNWTIAR